MQNRSEQLDEMEELFPLDEDKESIRQTKKIYMDAKSMQGFALSSEGKKLIGGLKEEISRSLDLLIETREGRYLSDVASHLKLLTNITGAKNQTQAIGSWIDSLD